MSKTDSEKIDRILNILEANGAPAGDRPAYETPELTAAQVVIDGSTVNRDGSTWAYKIDGVTPDQVVYGYVNQAKDPALWEAMRQIMGDEMLERTLGAGVDQWLRYKPNARGYVNTGQANAVTLGGLFSNPLPAFKQ